MKKVVQVQLCSQLGVLLEAVDSVIQMGDTKLVRVATPFQVEQLGKGSGRRTFN